MLQGEHLHSVRNLSNRLAVPSGPQARAHACETAERQREKSAVERLSYEMVEHSTEDSLWDRSASEVHRSDLVRQGCASRRRCPSARISAELSTRYASAVPVAVLQLVFTFDHSVCNSFLREYDRFVSMS